MKFDDFSKSQLIQIIRMYNSYSNQHEKIKYSTLKKQQIVNACEKNMFIRGHEVLTKSKPHQVVNLQAVAIQK